MGFIFPLLVLFLFHDFSSAEKGPNYSFMHNAISSPLVSYYDYIIIGGGTAGCPLAATLSQNATVLLLERGGSPYGNPKITNLSNFGATLSDVSPNSPAQPFMSEDGVVNARARVLGGGSCINAGFYSRASSSYIRNMGWDESLVRESYEWVEKLVAFEPPVKEWQSAVKSGLEEAGILPDNGFTYDHIGGTKVGGTIFDKDGHRHTAADLLEYANPSALTVLLHATVHKIMFRIKEGKRPMAHGLIYRDESGVKHRAYLNKGVGNEMIISAGALGSPQLLMLSGVGPAAQLKAHNITVVLDQPMVGERMSDNPMNAVFVPSPVPVEVSLIEVVGITPFGTYIEAASGDNFAAGYDGNYGTFSSKMQKSESLNFQGGFLLEKILGPVSTGYLELRTRNPNHNPKVTFNYFKDSRDLERCVRGMSTIKQVTESQSFSKFKVAGTTFEELLNMTANSRLNRLPKHKNTTTSLHQFCKDTVMTIWHYHGGCQVGSVVNGDYRVLGVDALRIVDGSTFNFSPGTNPQATVMMLGRYMGVKMLSERLSSEVVM